jgi:hypothetical protein
MNRTDEGGELTNSIKNNVMSRKLYIGIFAAIISAISDILLMYHPNLVEKYDHYAFLFEVNSRSNLFGWLLGMIFLPLLYLGYKGMKEISDEESRKSLDRVDWIVVFLIAIGCVVHSIYHFIPHVLAKTISIGMEIYSSAKFVELMFVSCYLMFCTIVTLQSFKKKNKLLFANRFFNPLFWMIIVAIVFAITPKYGGYLVVSSFNCSIAFYFIGVLINRKKVS